MWERYWWTVVTGICYEKMMWQGELIVISIDDWMERCNVQCESFVMDEV